MSDGRWFSWSANSPRSNSKNFPCRDAASAASAPARALGWYWRERRVPPDVAEVVAELVLHLLDRAGGLEAEAALEVAVLDDRVRRIRSCRTRDRASRRPDGRASGPNRGRGGSASETRKITVAIRNAMTDAASTPTRAWFCAAGSSIARSTMNSEIVKPMPHSAAPPAMRSSVRPGPNSPTPQQPQNGGGAEDADELADDQADDDSPGERRRHRAGQDLGVDHHARVGEGEQGEDHVRDVRGVGRLQSLVDRDRLAQAVGRRAGVLGVRRLPEGAREVERVLHVAAVGPVHRHQQRDRDAGERRVHARGEERQPHDHREGRVDRAAPAAQVPREVDADQARRPR